ncbi:NUDIX domain-containing protein [Bacillus cereus group sp. BfR-BA-01380]|uniref:NUDIX domain-containing protein n=1 Tax=Bacillus cereus group sp. BfR-BA-01380 TaxID=2920324 RepID=UPI001F58F48F|nr:NUDIX domain-containing protein [Bacillus cereus group sp. BfR-BA-01380]
MRDRGAAIIIQEGKLALIKRIRDKDVYYVFPGGGIEEGEISEEATVREVYEELGIHIQIKQFAKKVNYNGIQYFYEAVMVGGTFGNGKGEEYIHNDSDCNKYIPIWVPIKNVLNINIKPLEVGEYVYRLYENM